MSNARLTKSNRGQPREGKRVNPHIGLIIQILDFYCFALFTKVMTLALFTEITSIKEKRNITIHRQNKMCSVTKVA